MFLKQQILEKEFHQRNINSSVEKVAKPSTNSTIQTTTRATSPMKCESRTSLIERATSPVKQAMRPIVK